VRDTGDTPFGLFKVSSTTSGTVFTTNASNLETQHHVDEKREGVKFGGGSAGEGRRDRPLQCRLRLLPLTRQPITHQLPRIPVL